ncbi:MAG TPA: hypothetical protein VFH03_17390 [Actinoplanes sp.]|nr:hypothetical protein [Actinoplanes sp.]
MWILIAVVVLGLIALVAVTVPVVGRLAGLQRAVRRLGRRRQEAMNLQAGAAQLVQTVQHLHRRAETMQERVALIRAGHGEPTGRHAFPGRH